MPASVYCSLGGKDTKAMGSDLFLKLPGEPPNLHSLQLENSGAQSTPPELKQKRSLFLCEKETKQKGCS